MNNDELFFVDKVEEETNTLSNSDDNPSNIDTVRNTGLNKRQMKRLAMKTKPLRSELVLHRNTNSSNGHRPPIIPSSINKKDSGNHDKKYTAQDERDQNASRSLKSRFAKQRLRTNDNNEKNDTFDPSVVRKLDVRNLTDNKDNSNLLSYVADQHNRTVRNRGPSANKYRSSCSIDNQATVNNGSRAVIVDGPGLSINPDPQYHQVF